MGEDYLRELLQEISGRLHRIESRLDNIQQKGCQVGAQNSETLRQMQRGNAMAGGTAGAVVGGLIAGASMLWRLIAGGQP
jgi:hypothetical protein